VRKEGEGCNKDKIKNDFEQFLRKRAELVAKAVHLLATGRQINASIMFQDQ
jgi:hypothetical protein